MNEDTFSIHTAEHLLMLLRSSTFLDVKRCGNYFLIKQKTRNCIIHSTKFMLDVINFKRAASLWRLSDAWGLKAIMNLSKKKKEKQ